MYTDMALSNDLNAKFAEYVAEGAGGAGAGLGITFSVSVLQACAWPMTSQPVSPFAPPQQLERSITLFEAFYKVSALFATVNGQQADIIRLSWYGR